LPTPGLVELPGTNEMITVWFLGEFDVDARMVNRTRRKIPGFWEILVKDV
jgi:hypothetical protein